MSEAREEQVNRADDPAVAQLLAGLNGPQQEAVTYGTGPLLIVAGAGSGKTRVLTHRIAYMVATGQAQASDILAITFTNKAAAEMRERAELLVGRRVRAMWVMTFHAACARMLRAHADKLGYTRQFTIYDQADGRRLVKRVLEEQGVDIKRWTPAAIHSQISAAKNRLLDPDEYAQRQGSAFEAIVADAYRGYQSGLLSANAMDFDDLLVRAVDVLQLFPEVRGNYQDQFRHVLVDEYQDTNPVQYRWLQLLAGEHRNLTVVGDPNQSIYSFRSADIRNILEFEDDFPDAHVVKLEQNYRSVQTILDAANAVIGANSGNLGARLWSELGEGDPIKVRELEDEHAEARFVTGEIQTLVDGGASRAEIAVFYRTNAQSRVLQEQLGRAEIPYQVIGGTKFYDRLEVKDALSYLTLLVNPLDVGAFTRVVNQPKRGIGATSVAKVVSFANTVGTVDLGRRAGRRRRSDPRPGGRCGEGFWSFHGHHVGAAGRRRPPARRSRRCSPRRSRPPATSTGCAPSAPSRPRVDSRTSRSSSTEPGRTARSPSPSTSSAWR